MGSIEIYTLSLHDALPILTCGLAWEASIPPVEDSGKFMMTADSSGNLIFPRAYLEQRRQAALAGQIFNPSIGFVDRKSTRLNSSHANISYAVFCLKK